MRNRFVKVCYPIILLISIIFIAGSTYAKEVPYTLDDRDRIIRMEVKINEMDKRFEQYSLYPCVAFSLIALFIVA